MALFFDCCIVIAECACATLYFFADAASFVYVDPKYSNSSLLAALSRSSMLVDGLGLVLLMRILLSSDLISILYSISTCVFSSLSVSCWSSSSLLCRRSISSTYCR